MLINLKYVVGVLVCQLSVCTRAKLSTARIRCHGNGRAVGLLIAVVLVVRIRVAIRFLLGVGGRLNWGG